MEKELPDTPGSEEGLVGLTELEPSPVEESPAEAGKDGYFPSPSPSPPPLLGRSTTLGLNNHGPAYYLLRIQKYSSYTFTVFTAFHIANTSLIPLVTKSVPNSESYLLLTRPYYQSFPMEPLLVILPLAVHVGSGVALRLYRRRQNLQRYGAETRQDRRLVAWPKLSGTSALGYVLVPLVAGHAFTTRILPLYMHGDNSTINLSYVSHGFALHRLPSFLGFTALVSVAAWHVVWGWAKWLRWNPDAVTSLGPEGQLRKKRRWYTVNAISATVAGLWLAGGLGVVGRGGKTEGWIGREFDELYRHIPLLGRWM